MDSSKFIDDDKQKYQFLDLSKYQGIDKNRIKRMLFDRPVLLKHTDDFINAAKSKHVNEVYLISHALLETGAAKSELANGVEIDGKKYYNFYGVGALDSDPIKTGAEYAKNMDGTHKKLYMVALILFISISYLMMIKIHFIV